MEKKKVKKKKEKETKPARKKAKTKKSEKKKKETTKIKKESVKKTKEKKALSEKYIEAIGRRKTSVACVRFWQKKETKGKITINNKELALYFPQKELQDIVSEPIKKTKSNILEKGEIKVLTKGGGKRGQAEAIRLAISRLLLKSDEKLKTILKANSLLTRDSRKKERKKFGLKKARKAPQWQKR